MRNVKEMNHSIEAEIGGIPADPVPEVENVGVAAPPERPDWMKYLTAKTGPDDIEDYLGHPMNYNKSKPVAQIIRGLTGIFGAMDLAVIDIASGLMNFMKPKKVTADVGSTD